MSQETYTSQQIRAYLVGALPDAEVERFDELSLTDERFVGLLQAEENDLIDRYMRGELSGETLENFETHYLASPRRREKVRFAETFREFGEQSAAKTKEFSKAGERQGFFAAFKNLIGKNLWQFGLAGAALVLLILGGVWFFNLSRDRQEITVKENQSAANKSDQPAAVDPKNLNQEIAAVNQQNDQPQNTETTQNRNTNTRQNNNMQPEKSPSAPIKPPKPTIASFMLTPALRGGIHIPTVSIGEETTDVAVRLELEAVDYADYRVILTDETGSANLWTSGIVQAKGGANKSLNVRFPARLLRSNVYMLVVSGVKDGKSEVLTNYTFRAVLK